MYMHEVLPTCTEYMDRNRRIYYRDSRTSSRWVRVNTQGKDQYYRNVNIMGNIMAEKRTQMEEKVSHN